MKLSFITFSIILAQFFALSNPIYARVHDFETTRMKSTGGAGVASILMNESAILNPAPVAFFKNSAFYVQRETFVHKGGSATQQALNKSYDDRSKNLGFIAADTKSNLSGAISYQKQHEGFDKRERMTASLASIIGDSSSLGFMFRRTKDENFISGNYKVEKYNQFVAGLTHAVNADFTLGAILVDPFKSKPGDSRLVIGAQYIYKKILTFMLDVGSDYNQSLAESRIIRGAAQLNIYSDLFIRFGKYEDKAIDEKGTGFGISWVGPKLVVEAALKNSKPLNLKTLGFERPDKIRTTSFSISYYF